MDAPHSILIAHGHAPVRIGLADALFGSSFAVVAEAADAPTAAKEAARLRPELCLIEVGLPGGGIEAVRDIAACAPATAILMVGELGTEDAIFSVLRAGARGWLSADTEPGLLVDVLDRVVAGEAALPRRMVAQLIENWQSREARVQNGNNALTQREHEVMEMMRAGLSTGEAAQRLMVSPVTVRRHVSNIVRKLGAKDRRSAFEPVR